MQQREKEIMSLLVQAHNLYTQLESTHPDDIIDWKNSIHRSQDILSRRILRRDYLNIYITVKPKNYTIEDCKDCKGTGTYRSGPFSEKCDICNGSGKIQIEI